MQSLCADATTRKKKKMRLRKYFLLTISASAHNVARHTGVNLMVYTVEELKKVIPNQIADAARFCGMSYSTMWRIFNGDQEPKESTLIALTKYVEKFNASV